MSTQTMPEGIGSAAAKFVGDWGLVSYHVLTAEGAVPGGRDSGRISYGTSGRMAVHTMSSERSLEEPTTDLQRSAAYQTYGAYFGTYSVDEQQGIVVHHVAGSLQPHHTGTDHVRHYSFSADGNTLTLRIMNNGVLEGALVWERLP